MSISLKSIGSLPANLLRQASKLPVRECDEVGPGHFVSYVDENLESYDVSLQLQDGDQVISHTCDCTGKKPVCLHKVALMLYLAKKGKKSSSLKKDKKPDRIQVLLDEADVGKLKSWVRLIIEKNKDLELSLEAYFSERKEIYSTEEVTRITYDVVKTVLGRKRDADATQVKKILQLWENLHLPIMEFVKADLNNPEAIKVFDALVVACMEAMSPPKVNKYVGGLVKQLAEPLNSLVNDEAWLNLLGMLEARIRLDRYHLNPHYINLFKSIYQVSPENRKIRLLDLLAERFNSAEILIADKGPEYAIYLFGLLTNHGMFEKYYERFLPVRYHHDYNLRLIPLLISIGQLQLAEKYCYQMITHLAYSEYNLAYYSKLKEIYEISGEKSKMISVIKNLLPYRFDYDDYVMVTATMKEEEKKKFRIMMMQRAKKYMEEVYEAEDLYFRIMKDENQIDRMIQSINKDTRTEMILQFFEVMALTNKHELLLALINRHNTGLLFQKDLRRNYDFSLLEEMILQYYDQPYLKAIITRFKGWQLKNNDFLGWLQQLVQRAKI